MRTTAWILAAACSLWLAACSPAPVPAVAVATVTRQSDAVVVDPPPPTDSAAVPTVGLTAPSLPPQPSPTARPGLEATDPTTVVLAAGKPTFVEFFAFW